MFWGRYSAQTEPWPFGDRMFPAPAMPEKVPWGHFSRILAVFLRFYRCSACGVAQSAFGYRPGVSLFSRFSSEKSAPGGLHGMAGAGNLRSPRAPNGHLESPFKTAGSPPLKFAGSRHVAFSRSAGDAAAGRFLALRIVSVSFSVFRGSVAGRRTLRDGR